MLANYRTYLFWKNNMHLNQVKLAKEIYDISGYDIWVSPNATNRLVCDNNDLQIRIYWAANMSSLEILMFDIHILAEFGYNPSRCFEFHSLSGLTGVAKDRTEKTNLKNFIELTAQCPQKFVRNKKIIEKMFELSNLSCGDNK